MKVASEWAVTSADTTSILGSGSYISTNLNMGSEFTLISGSVSYPGWVGPKPMIYARIGELAFAVGMPHVFESSSRYNWVFLFDQSTAAATRRVVLIEHDKTLNTLTYKGFITANWSLVAGNKTIRSGRAMVLRGTNGTVAVSGTAVTGTNTTFDTGRFSFGSRIGFGSTNPDQITTWYDVSSITNNTSLTLATSAGTIAAGTSYVIEEIQIALCITNATATNGGLFLIKGINYNTFNLSGTNIAEATLAGANRQGVYWIKDASTVTNQIGAGIALDDQTATGSRMLYFLNYDTTARARMFRFNIYGNMSGTLSGSPGPIWSSGPYSTRTEQAVLTASHVIPQINNLKIFSVNHGAASGASCLWFTGNATSTSRVYRAPVTGIASGSTSWVTDSMVEIPPGGTSTYPLSNSLSQADYSSSIDRIIIPTGATPWKMYVTQYKTDGSQFDTISLADTGLLNATTSTNSAFHPTQRAAAASIWTESGYMYFISTSATTTGINVLYVCPISTDLSTCDTSLGYVITPKIATPNATKLYKALFGSEQSIVSTGAYGFSPEGIVLYARTSGIDDNSGAWTLVPSNGDISGLGATSYIQFKACFKTFGLTMLTSRLNGITVTYENDSQDSHYQPSLTQSSTANRYFAWRQITTWGTSIPTMRVRMYNADTESLVLDDNTSGSQFGYWTYSTNSGSTWDTWSSGSDAIGNYIRYEAVSIPNNTTLRVILTQL